MHPTEKQVEHHASVGPCSHLNPAKLGDSASSQDQGAYDTKEMLRDANCSQTLLLVEAYTSWCIHSLAGTHRRMEDLLEHVMLSPLNMQCK